jgi:streptogramin lyase
MTDRLLSDAALAPSPRLVGAALASPSRRMIGFAVDCVLLIVPSLLVAVAAAAVALYITDREAFQAVRTELRERPSDHATHVAMLARIAPLLVRAEAAGLPPSVAVAVEESDFNRAGEILSGYTLVYSIGDDKPARPGTIRLDMGKLVPSGLRGAALFGTAALYFTFFASGRRRSTLGKRLVRTQVVKLDGEPLTMWESFERFGGYFASAGTFGLGLLDFWREPNRRLAHDRLSNTVVVRRGVVWGLLVTAAVVAAAGVALAGQGAPTDTVRALYAAAIEAYDRKDHAAYLKNMEAASAQRPVHPTFLRRLAGAYALNGRGSDAAGVLRKMATLSVYYNALDDPDFAAVRGDAGVQIAARALEALRSRRIGSSDIAWTIRDRMFVPEGIAYDPATRAFFVSSQYRRKIVRIDPSGTVQDFVPSGRDGLWMVFGMAVDPARRLLWAVSTAEPVMERYSMVDEHATGVFAFDIQTGALSHKYVLPDRAAAHRFDDITVSSNGRVFASDGGSGIVYTIAPGKSLEVFVAAGTIQGPNGLVTTPDGRWLYVSDYAGFIYRADTTTKAVIRLLAPPDVALYGIDGLTWHKGSLIGVQNGVDPARIVRLELSSDGTRISAARIIDMNHPRVAEPTIGVVAGDTYYYVANSFGALLRKPNSVLANQPLEEPVILKLRVE